MRCVFFSLLVVGAVLAQPAFAVQKSWPHSEDKANIAAEKPAADTRSREEQSADIARVEAYLSTISSIVANFSQTSADGSAGTGKFYLKRPGKMRWQYNPPTPILLVSDGKTVTYYDAGLDQISYIGVDDTLAGFLAKREIKLESESTKLTKFEVGGDVVRATIIQRKKPTEGSLTLEFSEKPLELKKMIAVDATGNETRVSLENAQFGPVLDDKLFIFTDPRSVNHKRNR